MTITQADVRLVQKCWFALSNHAERITSEFYTELFERYPEYRKFFRSDMKIQREKLMKMINIIINGIGIWEKIEPEIIKLGKYHAAIADFSAEDYHNVSETLIWVMCRYQTTGAEQVVSDEQMETAWRKLFKLISATMLNASKSDYKIEPPDLAL